MRNCCGCDRNDAERQSGVRHGLGDPRQGAARAGVGNAGEGFGQTTALGAGQNRVNQFDLSLDTGRAGKKSATEHPMAVAA